MQANASEAAHWQPFWQQAILNLHSKYENVTESIQAKSVMAFLLGIISHDISDALWHSLGMKQGFIDAMKNHDFNGVYSVAHITADLGGDFALSRFVNQNNLKSWSIPIEEVIDIYSNLGISITRSQLEACATGGFVFMRFL